MFPCFNGTRNSHLDFILLHDFTILCKTILCDVTGIIRISADLDPCRKKCSEVIRLQLKKVTQQIKLIIINIINIRITFYSMHFFHVSLC